MPKEYHMEGQEPTTQEPTNGNGLEPDAATVDPTTPVEVDKLPANVQNMIRELRTENAKQRRDFAEQLREATKKAEKGSEAEKTLGEITAQLEQTQLRAAFLEEAIRPDVGCINPKAAFLVANAEGLFNKRGEPDWAAIKAAAPELFGQRTKTPPGNAGSGVNSPPAQKAGMNEWIRKQAGYG
jgi:hypothetical protein